MMKQQNLVSPAQPSKIEIAIDNIEEHQSIWEDWELICAPCQNVDPLEKDGKDGDEGEEGERPKVLTSPYVPTQRERERERERERSTRRRISHSGAGARIASAGAEGTPIQKNKRRSGRAECPKSVLIITSSPKTQRMTKEKPSGHR